MLTCGMWQVQQQQHWDLEVLADLEAFRTHTHTHIKEIKAGAKSVEGGREEESRGVWGSPEEFSV